MHEVRRNREPRPRRRQSLARRRHRALFDDGLQHATASYWEKWFPADFITESFPGQFRNWFYAILAMSTMMEQRGAVQGAARAMAWCATRRARRCTSRRATPSPSTERRTRAMTLTDPKGEEPRLSADGRRPDPLAVLPQNPANEHQFGPGPAGGAAQQVHTQAVEHLRLLLQLCPARRLRSRLRRRCRSKDGPTSTAGFCPTCNC